ncbi:sensor histidine kinase [Amycolatopsis regifaucium]|uniref:histidine kinase n=1 Tax=Amycolatopsis regifaucium TaxID=546365 RepID=A0A154M4I2_9PSEU|nr:histidine kinase [Amycolatopsis regifaucium]KZB79518.1 histidine kinase [Amycolatopsis regifaucium]OKA07700.1 sensor histidine kinase [Amycolatopsis regifaucium]SFH05009.1 Histidine kinase [Amycolatopsis regifaucium]
MRLFGPLTDRATYRRWVYFILGGALSVPYLLFAAIVVPSLLPLVVTMERGIVIGLITVVLVMIASSFLPAVRVLEGAAVRELLDDPVPGVTFGPAGNWPVRLRSTAMYLLHVGTGCVVSLASLCVPVGFGFTIAAPFTGRIALSAEDPIVVPKGWASAWIPLAFLLGVVALAYLVWGAGAVLTRCAESLLGVSAAERIAQLEKRTEQLAERNRLARELHDSVGHALSVVTIQAGAARRTLRSDPDFTEQALTAIEDSARAALDDLDHVLGLLREEASARTPQSGLGELSSLVEATRLAGAEVTAEVRGEPSSVPPVVSREAYRILQECLTNALRHAGKVPVTVLVDAGPELLRLRVANPLGAAAPSRDGGGRGLRGMAERVDVLGGTIAAGRAEGQWKVEVAVPWGNRR